MSAIDKLVSFLGEGDEGDLLREELSTWSTWTVKRQVNTANWMRHLIVSQVLVFPLRAAKVSSDHVATAVTARQLYWAVDQSVLALTHGVKRYGSKDYPVPGGEHRGCEKARDHALLCAKVARRLIDGQIVSARDAERAIGRLVDLVRYCVASSPEDAARTATLAISEAVWGCDRVFTERDYALAAEWDAEVFGRRLGGGFAALTL